MRIGRYEVHDRLAQGALTDVYAAELKGDAGFARALVVRKLREDQDKTRRDVFVHESKAGAAHEHPHIAQVFDLGVEGDSFFLVTEFVEGVAFDELVARGHARGEPLTDELIVWIMSNLIDGVAAIHEVYNPGTGENAALVLRDLAPSSVLLSESGQVKLTCYGIPSHALPPFAKQAELSPSRIRYLAPERIISGPLDPRSDVYSLGALLIEAITGVTWYGGLNATELIRRILSSEPPKPLDMDPTFEPTLAAICEKATARHPSHRYANAHQMRDALADWLRGRTHGVNARALGERVQTLASDICVRPHRPPPGFDDMPKTVPMSPEEAREFFEPPKTAVDSVKTPSLPESRHDSFDFDVDFLAQTLHGEEADHDFEPAETVRLQTNKRILWADPNEGSWPVAHDALDKMFQVNTTGDFLDACLALLAREYDVAVVSTALMADGLDGYDLTRLVRGLLPQEKTPLWATSVPNPAFPIVLLNDGGIGRSERELALAAFSVMSAPVSVNTIRSTLSVFTNEQ
jgi:serine/threonine-protein kinase